MGVTAIESVRGHSSSQQNPFVILRRPNTTEDSGEAFGFSFVYSGNFLAMAEVDTYDVTRFTMGINPRQFSWLLEPGESFQTPEVLLTWSDEGLNGLSQTLHHLLRERVARGPWRDKERPVLLNNWEATGMEFNQEEVLRIAQKGAEVGVELFVLDDGWFGKRTEYSGLGDWFADKSKLPGGVKGLSDAVNALGLNFGIWIEPEMVNEDSDLYRAHPEYVLCTPDRNKSVGRNQLVLDYSNPEVVDYVYEMLVKAFEGANISYIKWDMNRSITECYSNHWPAQRQGEVYHRYILGVYSLYEKLLKKYPNLLFESCASGGCRFDAGMLYYAPQAWCSDDTDAMERVKIQYGSSYGYPVSSWGAHVSECPNQQLGRNTPLRSRANVAYFGAFGYEMDLNQLSEAEIEEVKAQVVFFKEHRALFQFGSFYRLRSPWAHHKAAWMVVSQDKKEAIVGLYQQMNQVNNGLTQIPLQGLDADLDYCVDGTDVFGGDELMRYGITPLDSSAHPQLNIAPIDRKPEITCDYDSHLYHLRAVD
jgi:alpha-galactosidase